jgi:hypothetical protein
VCFDWGKLFDLTIFNLMGTRCVEREELSGKVQIFKRWRIAIEFACAGVHFDVVDATSPIHFLGATQNAGRK